MRRFVIAMGLVALVVTAPLHAAKWIPISHGSNGTVTLLDTENIATSGAVRRAWLKQDYTKYKAEKARYSIQQWEFDCVEKTMRGLTGAYYWANGTTMERLSGSSKQAVIPDSVGETMFHAVCMQPIQEG